MLLNEGQVRIPSGCAIAGIINRQGQGFGGGKIIDCIANMHQRSNGLGGGFAAYGIYPGFAEYYALHIYFDCKESRNDCERYLTKNFNIRLQEPVPVRKQARVNNAPIIWRYFAQPKEECLAYTQLDEHEFTARAVMHINAAIPGAFVASSGHNMGAFKGVGYPEDIGEFFRLEDYQAYLWTAHGRFPTNTPGWWGGAHPFTLLEWSVVHNGEISSYDANQRFLQMHEYRCTLQTDTEVITYSFDLLMRKERFNLAETISVIAAPFWSDINDERIKRLRRIYGGLLLNGPFSIIVATGNGLIAVNDRIKLRPLVAARKGEFLYVASEESAIRVVEAHPDEIWSPGGGEPVIGLLADRENLLDLAPHNDSIARPA
ncbi:Glutamate synthase large subunit domain 1 stand-alone protein [Syntrophomonas zehnderi OL-4]|uniref:Glutamate synthase large subunit domain 1 stand-alone protein n=1 Tax=Syntrophomonas zehnderi OL-4 TaxID=690567 RepID=A0A0E4GAN7_9FIRM|nr:glutamine amidotransferase family protein [Syntrophomonas zehnderi]CFX56248.1 Glutamate synthase large subunit domain 1 stand-alone protein [Syntrophomonas zehnderi OL-4]